MTKSFEIKANTRIELFQFWLAACNWTLGKNSLTESELKILSYFLYYNDKYKSIQDLETRFELLFSNSIKKKIKEEFGVESQKLETYLNKLRKKGVITSTNSINSSFLIYPENKIILSYNFINSHNTISTPHLDTQVPEPITNIVSSEEFTEIINTTEEIIETSVSSGNLWDKYMTNTTNKSIPSWTEE